MGSIGSKSIDGLPEAHERCRAPGATLRNFRGDGGYGPHTVCGRRTASDNAICPNIAEPSSTTATVSTEPGRHTSTMTVHSAPYAIWVKPYSPDAAPIA